MTNRSSCVKHIGILTWKGEGSIKNYSSERLFKVYSTTSNIQIEY